MAKSKKRVKKPVKSKTVSRRKKSPDRKKIIFFLVITILTAAAFLVYKNSHIIDDALKSRQVEKIKEKIDVLNISLKSQTWDAVLCFGDENSDMLVREYRKVNSTMHPQKKAEVVLNELLKGPRAKGVQTIPGGTRLLSVNIGRDGVAVVNFSSELSTRHPGGTSSELLTVNSIVNTLAENIEETKQVKIQVDGNDVDTIAGHIDCRRPFYPDRSIIR